MDLETVDHLLTTTRAVRRRLDFTRPVPRQVIDECLSLALQAPTGGNRQDWRWIVVTDPDTRARLADLYREGAGGYFSAGPTPEEGTRQRRVRDSAQYLAEHLQDAPVHVIPCLAGRRPRPGAAGASVFASIYPAVWSFQLALRSRGLGTCLTTLHLTRAEQAAELLGIPAGTIQAALLPVAYFTGGDFHPAERLSVDAVTFRERWGRT
jgi:nitroreductase